MHTHAHTSRKRAHSRQNICARVYDSYVRVRARIFTGKKFAMKYSMKYSIKYAIKYAIKYLIKYAMELLYSPIVIPTVCVPTDVIVM